MIHVRRRRFKMRTNEDVVAKYDRIKNRAKIERDRIIESANNERDKTVASAKGEYNITILHARQALKMIIKREK